MKSNNGVAAVVVLFNPDNDCLHNINSYRVQVDRVFAIDNSDIKNLDLINKLKEFSSVTYISNNGNKGIAHALNSGIEFIKLNDYKWVLTMDQDTYLEADYVSRMCSYLNMIDDRIGLLAPRYSRSYSNETQFEQVLLAMTSGSFLNIEAYNQVGPFNNNFFIDHVDHEYCLRLALAGYKVYQINSIFIHHVPGSERVTTIFGMQIPIYYHSPIRLYYFVRNGFTVSKNYGNVFPEFRKVFSKLLIKEILKTPFSGNFMKCMVMLFRGFYDYRRGIFGKYIN